MHYPLGSLTPQAHLPFGLTYPSGSLNGGNTVLEGSWGQGRKFVGLKVRWKQGRHTNDSRGTCWWW